MASTASATTATQTFAGQQSAPGVAATTLAPQAPAFEPQMPDTGILAAQGLVLALTLAAAGYWWLVVVPSERAALGRSKRLGQLDGYLQELERPEAAQSRGLERWFYTDWLRKRQERRRQRQQQQPGAAASDGAAAAADDGAADAAQPDDPNLLRPSAATPTPRFLSLDNPIVATGALLLLAGVASGLQQR